MHCIVLIYKQILKSNQLKRCTYKDNLASQNGHDKYIRKPSFKIYPYKAQADKDLLTFKLPHGRLNGNTATGRT